MIREFTFIMLWTTMEGRTETIEEWCKKETIFLTGGTGFIGKALIYKLLAKGATKIYVLVRPKRGQNIEERLDNLVQEEIYEALVAKDANIRSKLIAVAGDITEPGMAISQEDRKMLQEEITLVIHSAASVRFDDPLKKAVNYNLRPTSDIVELAKGMKKLKLLHYISTAFSNFDHIDDGIEETMYPRHMNWRKLIEFVNNNPDEMSNCLEQKLLGDHPNTYLFTKHLAESVIEDASEHIPVLITRPAIVSNSWKEPIPGWMDSLSSPTALGAAILMGVIRIVYCNPDAGKAYCCVDICVNTIIVASWQHIVNQPGKADQVPVYNIDYKAHKTIDNFRDGINCENIAALSDAIWRPRFKFVNDFNLYWIYHIILHVLPAVLVDNLLKLAGKKPRLLHIYRKIYSTTLVLGPLTEKTDRFVVKKVDDLEKKVPDEEKAQFPMKMFKDSLSVQQYQFKNMEGIRKFFKYPPHPTEKDYERQRRLILLDDIFRFIFYSLILWNIPFQAMGSLVWNSYTDCLNFLQE